MREGHNLSWKMERRESWCSVDVPLQFCHRTDRLVKTRPQVFGDADGTCESSKPWCHNPRGPTLEKPPAPKYGVVGNHHGSALRSVEIQRQRQSAVPGSRVAQLHEHQHMASAPVEQR